MNPTTKKSEPQTSNHEPLIGAHESISGGIYKAFERGASVGCRTLQVFTKNNNQWQGKPLTDEDVANYKIAQSKSNIAPVIAHDSYLINLCAADSAILKKSRESFVDELQRCELLGIPYLNFHPGSHIGKGEEDGIKLIIESLNLAHEQTKGFCVLSVLETTAGQGTAIGYKFEHLRIIIDGVDEPERMAVCIDTCHIFAAGYDISTEKGYEKTMQEFDEVLGLKRLVAFHVNDSKKPLGLRVDRHEHIGKGFIGENGFRFLMQDSRFTDIPKILETPKSEDLHEDKMNLSLLKKLALEL
ncbi:MAG: deoxyribonuclease IV [Ignavibacteriae bacterium]|nr:deoxyribonuclease IV [Ignavibacteriota bacterium]